MHNAITVKSRDIGQVCRQYGVRRLEIFGSAARGVDFESGRSDVDFLVEFDRINPQKPLDEFMGLQSALSRVLGCKVDLVEAGALKNPYLLASINRDRELVYAA